MTKSTTTILALAGLTASLWAAPPPAPVGFIWSYLGRSNNPANNTNVPFVRTGIAIHDEEDNIWSTGGGTINLGVSAVTLPGNDPGTLPGDRYHEMVDNSMSLNFGITGDLSASGVPGNRQYRVMWDYSVGSQFIAGDQALFRGSFNLALDEPNNTALLTGLSTDGSTISFDAGGQLTIFPRSGNGGDAVADITNLSFTGTATINQSYDSWQLTSIAPIPEPQISLLALSGLSCLFLSRRRHEARKSPCH